MTTIKTQKIVRKLEDVELDLDKIIASFYGRTAKAAAHGVEVMGISVTMADSNEYPLDEMRVTMKSLYSGRIFDAVYAAGGYESDVNYIDGPSGKEIGNYVLNGKHKWERIYYDDLGDFVISLADELGMET